MHTDIEALSAIEKDDILNEINLLGQLNHPSIIQYVASFVRNNKHHIVMEYATGGSLFQVIKETDGIAFNEDNIWEWFAQLAQALEYVHSQNILHRDIKTQNILLWDENRRVIKLADFGIAKVIKSQLNLAKTLVGTPYYLSPELCEGKPYNNKSDIWSLGVVLYELLGLVRPFNAESIPGLILSISKGVYPSLHGTTSYSEELLNVVDVLLTLDAAERPSMPEICAFPPVSHSISLWKTIESHVIQTQAELFENEANKFVLQRRDRRNSVETDINDSASVLSFTDDLPNTFRRPISTVSTLEKVPPRSPGGSSSQSTVKSPRSSKAGRRGGLAHRGMTGILSPFNSARSEDDAATGVSLVSVDDLTARLMISNFIAEGRRVYRWGWGQKKPVLEEKLFGMSIEKIAACKFLEDEDEDFFHLALDEYGRLFSWGNNSDGQLGHGNLSRYRNPQVICYFQDKYIDICDVSCGLAHSIALSHDGKVYAWGDLRSAGGSEGLVLRKEKNPENRPSLKDMSPFASASNVFEIDAVRPPTPPDLVVDSAFNDESEEDEDQWPDWAKKKQNVFGEFAKSVDNQADNSNPFASLEPNDDYFDHESDVFVTGTPSQRNDKQADNSNSFVEQNDDYFDDDVFVTGKLRALLQDDDKQGDNPFGSSGQNGDCFDVFETGKPRASLQGDDKQADNPFGSSEQEGDCFDVFVTGKTRASFEANLSFETGIQKDYDLSVQDFSVAKTSPKKKTLKESIGSTLDSVAKKLHMSISRRRLSSQQPSIAENEVVEITTSREMFTIEPTRNNPLDIGNRVHLIPKKQLDCGWIRFIGRIEGKGGIWVGVELDLPEGKNDGTVDDERYFHCDDKHGIFVRPQSLKVAALDDDASVFLLKRDIVVKPANTVSEFVSPKPGITTRTNALTARSSTLTERSFETTMDDGCGDIYLEPRMAFSLNEHFVIEVSCGNNFTAVITRRGFLFTWGENSYGQLGSGDDANSSLPTRVILENDATIVKSIATGAEHMLALTGDGAVFAWGCGMNGQLGLGVQVFDEPQCSPQPVLNLSRDICGIAAGARHCAAITHQGELYTWGAGEDGQLGHGNTDDVHGPIRVQSLGRNGEDVQVMSVQCGSKHSVVLTDLRNVYVTGRLSPGAASDLEFKCVTSLAGSSVIALSSGSFAVYALSKIENPQDGL